MLEDHLAAPVTRSRLRAGPAADYVDAFADWLHHRDYKPTTIEPALRALAGWTDWMRGAGFSGRDLLAGYQACKAALDRERRRRRRYRAASKYSLVVARLFIRFLQERDVIPRPAAPLSPIVRWPVSPPVSKGTTSTGITGDQGTTPGRWRSGPRRGAPG